MTQLLQDCHTNYGVSSDAKSILFVIFGVVTTLLLQECCANYEASSDMKLILFRIFVS